MVTVGLFIAGQMIASLLLDGGGLLGVEREPIGVGDGLGIAAVLAGVALIVRSNGAKAGAGVPRRSRRGQAGWTVLALAAGAVLPRAGGGQCPRRALTPARLAGVALLLIAVALIQTW